MPAAGLLPAQSTTAGSHPSEHAREDERELLFEVDHDDGGGGAEGHFDDVGGANEDAA